VRALLVFFSSMVSSQAARAMRPLAKASMMRSRAVGDDLPPSITITA